jgi:hypothetical protein
MASLGEVPLPSLDIPMARARCSFDRRAVDCKALCPQARLHAMIGSPWVSICLGVVPPAMHPWGGVVGGSGAVECGSTRLEVLARCSRQLQNLSKSSSMPRLRLSVVALRRIGPNSGMSTSQLMTENPKSEDMPRSDAQDPRPFHPRRLVNMNHAPMPEGGPDCGR